MLMFLPSSNHVFCKHTAIVVFRKNDLAVRGINIESNCQGAVWDMGSAVPQCGVGGGRANQNPSLGLKMGIENFNRQHFH